MIDGKHVLAYELCPHRIYDCFNNKVVNHNMINDASGKRNFFASDFGGTPSIDGLPYGGEWNNSAGGFTQAGPDKYLANISDTSRSWLIHLHVALNVPAGTGQGVFLSQVDSAAPTKGIYLLCANTKFRIQWYRPATTSIDTAAILPLNQKFHIFVFFNSANRGFTVFFNKTIDGTVNNYTTNTDRVTEPNNPIHFGTLAIASASGGLQGFGGAGNPKIIYRHQLFMPPLGNDLSGIVMQDIVNWIVDHPRQQLPAALWG